MTDQVTERKSFEFSPWRLLQDSRRYSICRTWFRCKAHHADHWRPGLHGWHWDAKTISWQGSWRKPCCILFACLMFLTVPSLSTNLLSGEDDREAWLLEGYPQSGDKLNDLSDGRSDSDVPPSQCWTASLPFQLSVNNFCCELWAHSPVLFLLQEAGFLSYSVFHFCSFFSRTGINHISLCWYVENWNNSSQSLYETEVIQIFPTTNFALSSQISILRKLKILL
jgi:hypothetical protein